MSRKRPKTQRAFDRRYATKKELRAAVQELTRRIVLARGEQDDQADRKGKRRKNTRSGLVEYQLRSPSKQLPYVNAPFRNLLARDQSRTVVTDLDGKPFCPTGMAQRYHDIGECDCIPLVDPERIERVVNGYVAPLDDKVQWTYTPSRRDGLTTITIRSTPRRRDAQGRFVAK